MSYRPQRSLQWAPVMGPGGAMGDSAPAMTPVESLVSQVNRFGPAAPPSHRFSDRVFPVLVAKIDPPVALTALLIYQRRFADAYSQFHDAASASAIDRANAGFADPVGFVTANLAEVTTAIAGFADSLGLEGPVYSGGGSGSPLDNRTLLLAAGGLLVLWMVTR